jgi:hypothetical protein
MPALGFTFMTRLLTRHLITIALALCTWAAAPLAHVSSTQPFDLNGAAVPVAGIASWPLYAGDLIVTHSAPATVVFRGGSRIVLEPNSELKIDAKDRKPVIALLRGSGKYFLAGAVVALSTKAALSLDGHDNPANSGTPPYPQPPSASPYR